MVKQIVAPYLSLLRNRNYRLWFASSLGSSIGDWVGVFALQILVVSLAAPGSRVALFGLGGIMMARLLPSLIFGPVAGVLADRYDRVHVMVVTDLARCALFVAIAFSRNLVLLFALTFVVECMALLYMSAKDASLPAVVGGENLVHANQLNLMVTYGPLPFGAAAGAGMVFLANLVNDAGGPELDPVFLALLVNAATFLVAGVIISRLRLPQSVQAADDHEERRGLLEELRRGAAYVAGFPLIRSLIVGVVGVFFGAGVIVTLGPELVRSSLGRPSTDWFDLMSIFGIGLLIGLVLAPLIRHKVRDEVVFPVAMALAALVATVVAWLPNFTATTVAGWILGCGCGLSFVTGYTLLHENTSDELRARTFAVFYTSTRIAMFAALALAPFVAGVVGEWELALGDAEIPVSGTRVTIFLGGAVALAAVLGAGRGMLEAEREATT